jgi:hypothetical protein
MSISLATLKGTGNRKSQPQLCRPKPPRHISTLRPQAEGLLKRLAGQRFVTWIHEDWAQVAADGVVADAEFPDLAVPAAQLVEGGDHGREAQEAPEHEVGDGAAAPVGWHVAVNLRQQHDGWRVGAAPDQDAEPVSGERYDFVDDEVECWHHGAVSQIGRGTAVISARSVCADRWRRGRRLEDTDSGATTVAVGQAVAEIGASEIISEGSPTRGVIARRER